MKLWIDDVRCAPEGYVWCKSVNEAKDVIEHFENNERFMCLGCEIITISSCFHDNIDLIDIDHHAGFYIIDGGDYICLLEWLEETGRNYPIRIHSQNSVGVENMRRVVERNGWKEVF